MKEENLAGVQWKVKESSDVERKLRQAKKLESACLIWIVKTALCIVGLIGSAALLGLAMTSLDPYEPVRMFHLWLVTPFPIMLWIFTTTRHEWEDFKKDNNL